MLNLALSALLTVCFGSTAVSSVTAQSRGADPRGINKRLNALLSQPQKGGKHTFRGNMLEVPEEITRRTYTGKPSNNGGRAPGDRSIPRQTNLLTRLVPSDNFGLTVSPSQDLQPSWSSDEKYIYFASNREGEGDAGTGERADKIYNIFRMYPDGSGVTSIAIGSSNNLEPAISSDGSNLAYVGGGTLAFDAAFHITNSAGFSLFTLNLDSGAVRPLSSLSQSGSNFSELQAGFRSEEEFAPSPVTFLGFGRVPNGFTTQILE